MKILLIGSGAREHALAWRLAQSERCTALYCAPGNAGMEECAERVPIATEDIPALVNFTKEKAIDLVVIGPEGPLVAGLTDRLQQAGIKVFGPTAAAARLEGSKAFMKDLCRRYKVPTAAYGCFSDIGAARTFIAQHGAPLVVKADGLAAGKGVVIAGTTQEAEEAASEMLSGRAFGAAGRTVVIEEFLEGPEVSYFALADGRTVLPLASAQDYKRAGDGNAGPNTGGMGAISPAPALSPELARMVDEEILKPVIAGMAKEGCPFTGVLFAGLMIVKGRPVLLEFNVRFGDPECQTLMMRLENDLLEVLVACAEGRLGDLKEDIHWKQETALCVVMAARGYPGPHARGSVIGDLAAADSLPGVKVFHAGTERDEQGRLTATGGRTLGVTARGTSAEEARKTAYEAIEHISWPGGFCRGDIGHIFEIYGKNEDKISISF